MQAVWYMMAKQGFQNIIVYLDDFLAIGATQEECTQAYKVLLQLLQDLGFTISEGKLVQALNFYYNASTGQASWLSTNNQLQWLAGKLNWTCRAVYSGQTFLYQVIHTINSLSLGAKYCLTLSFCHDTAWWVNFLRAFNGKRFLDDRPTVDVMTDACTLAAGGQFRGDWFYFNSSINKPGWFALHIHHTETLAIVLAAQLWEHLWANYWVVIYSDNQPAAQIINKGTTGHTTITGTLRALFWLSAVHNFYITAIYLEGSCNTTADAISTTQAWSPLFLLLFSVRDSFEQFIGHKTIRS